MMKRPLAYSIIAVLAAVFAFMMMIAATNTGDLFVRAFVIAAALAAVYAGHAVWQGEAQAPRRLLIWGIVTLILAAAVFGYAQAYALRPQDRTLILVALGWCAAISGMSWYVRRHPWIAAPAGDPAARK
jgi:hypothetical protein